MENKSNINYPLANETPAEYAQRIGVYYSTRHNKK